MKRLSHIEGLRAYLAFWVVFDHVLGACGYSVQMLHGLTKIIRQGWLSVDIFIIISGFVIFYLLDNKNEKYKRFIIRRFFRLWPLFIILFAIGIPTSILSLSNLHEFSDLYPKSSAAAELGVERIHSWWDHIYIHIGLHLPMLHGIVPDAIVPSAPSAFLGPAWSISLEWQFYLIAPFVFGFLVSKSKSKTAIVSAATLFLFFLAIKLPKVQFGAFLPMHVEYFYLGGLSYFVFRWLRSQPLPFSLTPLSLAAAIFAYVSSGWNPNLLPMVLWMLFFTLLIDLQKEKKDSFINLAGWFFNNKFVLYLGKISYSIYLSHALVIVYGQFLILMLFPSLTQKEHALALGVIVPVVSVVLSHALYKVIEYPGMKIGKRIADSI